MYKCLLQDVLSSPKSSLSLDSAISLYFVFYNQGKVPFTFKQAEIFVILVLP
jgi:hypothetical protein